MRVLFIGREYPKKGTGGGIGRVFQELFECKRKFEMEMVLSHRFEKDSSLTGNAHFIKIWGKHPFDKMIYGKYFKKFLEKHRGDYDIYNFHFPSGIFPYYFTKKILKNKKTVITVHTTAAGLKHNALDKIPLGYLSWKEIFSKNLLWRWIAKYEQKSFDCAENITAVSEKIARELEEYYGVEDVEVIKNGIRRDRIIYNPKKRTGSTTILYIGRHTAQKGIPFGIYALKEIKEDFIFYIAGKGALYDKIKSLSTKINVKKIKLLGFVPHEKLNDLYNSVDILLMPSLYEGLPMVALEGMAAGLPILGFKGAVLDEIVCKENKKLINETLDINGLRDSIKFLINNPDIREEIGKKNRERFLKYFTAERMAKEYYEYFKRV